MEVKGKRAGGFRGVSPLTGSRGSAPCTLPRALLARGIKSVFSPQSSTPPLGSSTPPLRKAGEYLVLGRFLLLRREDVVWGPRLPLQILDGHSLPQVFRQPGQLPQYLPRRRIPAVDAFLLAFDIDHLLGHSTRPMKVQVVVEV